MEGNLGSVACGNVTVVRFPLLCMKQTSYLLALKMSVCVCVLFPIGALVYAYHDTFIDADLTDKFMFLLVFIISLYV